MTTIDKRHVRSHPARNHQVLQLLRRSREAVLTAGDERTFLQEVCGFLVELCGYRMAWVGRVGHDENEALLPFAHAGFDEGYLDPVGKTWTEAPAAQAITSGKVQVIADIGEHPYFASHPELALAGGYRSVAAVPLRADGRPLGALQVYATEIDAFDADALETLDAVAADMSLGLTLLRTRRERDRAVHELGVTNRRLQAFGDGSRDLLARFDEHGRFTFVGGSIARDAAWEPQAMFGRTPSDLAICEDPASDRELLASIARVIATGAPEQLEVSFNFAGKARRFEVRHVPEWDSGAVIGVLAIARDLTSQRAAERQLYLLNYALDNVSDAIYLMKDESPRFEYVNEAAVRALGYTRAELLSGMGVLDIDPNLDEANWTGLVKTMKKLRHGRVESTHRARDGHVFPIEVTGNFFEFEGNDYDMAIVRDISERRSAEAARRTLEDQLRQAQKMEAVGQLAGGIAHDFNNVLVVIQMAAAMLLEEKNLRAEVSAALGEICAAADRAANLTRQLLVFSRRQVADPINLDLADTARGMTSLLRRLIGEHITLETDLPTAMPAVYADPGMMEQVLLNLALNARDAMAEGGHLVVGVAACRATNPQGLSAAGSADDRAVCLTVSDTGCGIPVQNLSRIYEPFFTTKAVGKGSGLGLATVFGIVELHRGWVDVKSVVGEGTTFRVFLPAVEGRPSPRRSTSRAASYELTASETVLLVEDDQAVRAMTRAALARYGYRVFEADSAASALSAFQDLRGQIDLLLTDLVMPGSMTGRQLAETLTTQKPALNVVFTSGYSPDFNFALQLPSGQLLIQKPYTPAVLASALRRCLDR